MLITPIKILLTISCVCMYEYVSFTLMIWHDLRHLSSTAHHDVLTFVFLYLYIYIWYVYIYIDRYSKYASFHMFYCHHPYYWHYMTLYLLKYVQSIYIYMYILYIYTYMYVSTQMYNHVYEPRWGFSFSIDFSICPLIVSLS